MEPILNKEPAAIRLPRTYDAGRLLADLRVLRDVDAAPQPGPYHKGEWTGIALHSLGGKDSVFPSAPGLDQYRETESLKRTLYFKWILDDIQCTKKVVRIFLLILSGNFIDIFVFLL